MRKSCQHKTGQNARGKRYWGNSYPEWRIVGILLTHALASFKQCGDALTVEFQPTLTEPEVMRRISNEYKRPNETYREYADRLTTMANATRGGMLDRAIGLQVLLGFLFHAYPKYADTLKAQVDLRIDNPTRELVTTDELGRLGWKEKGIET